MIWEPWESRLYEETIFGKQTRNIRDLLIAGQLCPIIAAHWKAWECGSFSSFEQMLIHLAIEQAEHNKKLFRDLVESARVNCNPIAFDTTKE